ncbi:unnamed protein product [Camellia sinensis]
MYKNQLQELAQRSCFNLPSYSCIREGPDHAPRFKATVNFNGETFESRTFCSTLRQAEHAAAEVALTTLANRGPSKALAARVLGMRPCYWKTFTNSSFSTTNYCNSCRGNFIIGEEMDCPIPACAKCTLNCLLIHGKNKDPSTVATSFFKIMIEIFPYEEENPYDRKCHMTLQTATVYSGSLFLPPKFARTVSDLIDQKTQLEDASGQRWTVTLSKYDGSLAFQQGWLAFSLEHGLEIGDFVLFHYIEQSHFVVQIYGKSGCEKLYFPKENSNQKKRTKANRDSCAKDEQCHTIDNVSINSMNKEGSNTSTVSGSESEISQRLPMVTTYTTSNIDNVNERLHHVPRTKCIEEPFYMIDRDSWVGQVDRLSSV